VEQAAAVLSNQAGQDGTTVAAAYRRLLTTMAARQAEAGPLAGAVAHFLKVTASYQAGLFACYDVPGLPRTNNDLEHAFGAVRYHERRATGRKGASPGLVVRGEVRLVAALATGLGLIREADPPPVGLSRWQTLRQKLEGRQATRRAQRAFRRDPTGYLEALETALLKPVLPA
jgi:hypothetical protein